MSESGSQSHDLTPAEHRFNRLVDLPPSAKCVFKVLEYDAPLTPNELSEQTRLPMRTTRYALSQLEDADLVTKHPVLTDVRQQQYQPCEIQQPVTTAND